MPIVAFVIAMHMNIFVLRTGQQTSSSTVSVERVSIWRLGMIMADRAALRSIIASDMALSH